MMGSRAISGSLATKLRNAVMACTHPHGLVHVDVQDVGPAAHLFESHRERSSESPALMRLANFFEPETLVRSPMRNEVRLGPDGQGVQPPGAGPRARFRPTSRDTPCTACAIARMWSGVVPQHPPRC